MKPYIDALKSWLTEHPPFWGESGRPTILEFLQTAYREFNPIDSDRIRASLQALHTEFEDLPFERWERLFEIVSDICVSCEDEAFASGLLLGANLIQELENHAG